MASKVPSEGLNHRHIADIWSISGRRGGRRRHIRSTSVERNLRRRRQMDPISAITVKPYQSSGIRQLSSLLLQVLAHHELQKPNVLSRNQDAVRERLSKELRRGTQLVVFHQANFQGSPIRKLAEEIEFFEEDELFVGFRAEKSESPSR